MGYVLYWVDVNMFQEERLDVGKEVRGIFKMIFSGRQRGNMLLYVNNRW